MKNSCKLLPWLGALLTGFLLASSFHPLAWDDAAWFAFIPLFLAVRKADSRCSLQLGFAAGFTFWLISIFWITRVAWVGWFFLSAYCAVYTMLFSFCCAKWLNRFGVLKFIPNIGFIFFATTTWVVFEYVRATFLTGFAWNSLGVSQYRNLALIQIAEFGGVYAVSALIVWMNAAMGITALRYIELRGKWGRRPHPELILGFLVLAILFVSGLKIVRRSVPADTTVSVALIQPNILQDEKWSMEKIQFIYSRLRELTAAALTVGKPDLVVWPETAVPDDVRASEPSYQLVYELATNGVPILVGSMDTAWPDDGGPVYYNSSFLFDETGAVVEQYDKRHLVVFGEYVPMRHVLPFMKALTPIQESFSSGSTSTVFHLREDIAFSVLICFEDTVAGLARESVKNGARLFINQTNDAWFDPLWASWQHMAQCVFRCVENRVPAVRCANTGITCYIDELGRVVKLLSDGRNSRIDGFLVTDVGLQKEGALTFYTKHGDVFVIACLAVCLVLFSVCMMPTKQAHECGEGNLGR